MDKDTERIPRAFFQLFSRFLKENNAYGVFFRCFKYNQNGASFMDLERDEYAGWIKSHMLFNNAMDFIYRSIRFAKVYSDFLFLDQKWKVMAERISNIYNPKDKGDIS